MNSDFKLAIKQIEDAEGILICAGAGMGVDSGLPDFRGSEGFWKAYPALQQSGKDFYQMADPINFNHDPKTAWGFYGHRLNLYRETIPHQGFQILKSLCESKKFGGFVFTSNVDGQFQKAGFNENQIVECHGSIHHMQCQTPCHQGIWLAGHEKIEVDMSTCTATNVLPKCPKCERVCRPNILMFGDSQWLDQRTEAQYQRLNSWLNKANNIVVLEFGAGKAVPTVRMMSERIGQQIGVPVVRVNPRDAEFGYGSTRYQQISISLTALEGITNLTK